MNLSTFLISNLVSLITAIICMICFFYGIVVRRHLAGHIAVIVNYICLISLCFAVIQVFTILGLYSIVSDQIPRTVLRLGVAMGLLLCIREFHLIIKGFKKDREEFRK